MSQNLLTIMLACMFPLAGMLVAEPEREAIAPLDHCFRCTLVIGYSQVGQFSRQGGGWFVSGGKFAKAVGADRWQLLWQGGAGVDRWQNPDYPGWRRPLVSPVSIDPDKPDRIVLSVSGGYGSDENAWAQAIEATIDTIKGKYPTARQIVLQPVVGGPDGRPCPPPSGSGRVRASWQHAHIHNAIKMVVERRAGDVVRIVEGFAPQVRSSDDYSDALGHLTHEAAAAIGKTIGEYYAQRDEACRKAGHPHCGKTK